MVHAENTLDIHRTRDTLPQDSMLASLNSLIQTDLKDHATLRPDLAERWEVSSDGRVITFSLRRDVTWHDGEKFTAADVLFTIEKIAFDKGGYVSHVKERFAAMEKAEVVDDFTVRVTLKQPSVSFLTGMADEFLRIYPKHRPFPEFDARPVGTGPFKVVEYIRGSHVNLTRNDNFFRAGAERLPYLDGLNLLLVTDVALRAAAFRTGRIDGTGRAANTSSAY